MPAVFRELALAQAREMFRDLKTLFATVLYPFAILAIFLLTAFVTPKTGNGPGFATMAISMTLFLCTGATGFFGIAVPLVQLRERGTLRLLSTTPLRRATLLAAQAPSRLVVTAFQIVVILAVGLAAGAIAPAQVPMLLLACVLGLVVFAPLGYFIGGRAPSSEATNTITALGVVVLMFASGLVFPLDGLPGVVQGALRVLPTTYLGDLLRQAALGVPPEYPLALGIGVIAAFGLLFSGLAVRTFRWDAGERA